MTPAKAMSPAGTPITMAILSLVLIPSFKVPDPVGMVDDVVWEAELEDVI